MVQTERLRVDSASPSVGRRDIRTRGHFRDLHAATDQTLSFPAMILRVDGARNNPGARRLPPITDTSELGNVTAR